MSWYVKVTDGNARHLLFGPYDQGHAQAIIDALMIDLLFVPCDEPGYVTEIVAVEIPDDEVNEGEVVGTVESKIPATTGEFDDLMLECPWLD